MENEFVITAIEQQKRKKDRYNIYTDGEYNCSLSAESIVVFGIKEGGAVGEDELIRAVKADNTQYAFDSAVNLISYKMRSKKELRDKLAAKKIDEAAIESAIEKLENYGYVNDHTYAKEFVQSSITGGRYGSKVIEYKLKQKGIDDDVIAYAMEEFVQEHELVIAKQQLSALKKKYSSLDKRKARQKIYAALLRRGFGSDIISTVLSGEEDFE